MKRLISVLILICIVGISPADAQRSRRNQVLAAGPMLGYVEMREALLWVQTTEAADVYFEYHPTDKPSATSKQYATAHEKMRHILHDSLPMK